MAEEFARLDESKSYASLHGNAKRARYMQNDCYYDHDGKRCHPDGSPMVVRARKAKSEPSKVAGSKK